MDCPLSGKPCDKARVYHITEIDNGQWVSFDLCQDCIQQYLIQQDQAHKTVNLLQNILKSVKSLFDALKKPEAEPEPEPEPIEPPQEPLVVEKPMAITCPVCGATFAQLAATMKMGCANCYKTFSTPAKQVVQTLQGSLKHVGKRPKTHEPTHHSQKKVLPTKYLGLKHVQLKWAVDEENYERAAEIRDKINEFEKLLNEFRAASEKKDQDQIIDTYRKLAEFVQADKDYDY
ncbi:MAG: UvrB/UvrC motif-containing protein [Candidatus Hermodarchaeia archaeon]|jgi:protein arginine kinase activator